MQESMQISVQVELQTPLYSHYLDQEREGFKKKFLFQKTTQDKGST